MSLNRRNGAVVLDLEPGENLSGIIKIDRSSVRVPTATQRPSGIQMRRSIESSPYVSSATTPLARMRAAQHVSSLRPAAPAPTTIPVGKVLVPFVLMVLFAGAVGLSLSAAEGMRASFTAAKIGGP